MTNDEIVIFKQIDELLKKLEGRFITFNQLYKLLFLLSPLYEEQLKDTGIIENKKKLEEILIKYIEIIKSTNKFDEEFCEKIIHFERYNDSLRAGGKLKKVATF